MELQHGWLDVNVSGEQSKLSGTPLYHPPPILYPHRTMNTITDLRIHFFVLLLLLAVLPFSLEIIYCRKTFHPGSPLITTFCLAKSQRSNNAQRYMLYKL